jgi:ATP-binding protein involved in chromosome partitioning
MTTVQTHNRQPIPGVKDMIAVSSGKGGVGKSTLSVNLAVAMARRGLKIGLMDTDIYGPNIPGLLGLEGKPELSGESQRLLPPHAYGLKAISMGLLIDPGTPVIWRGPMLAKMVSQFLFNVEWGEIDILLLDLPPGTGDVQITLTQAAPLTGSVIVTTPSAIALEDVRRGVEMFRQSEVPLLGLIENMSHFVCPQCAQTSAIFGEGGGEQTARTFAMPLLGQVPLDTQMRRCADAGTPLVHAAPDAPASQALEHIASQIVEYLDDRRD